ncbi:hypothetical protein [Lacibacter sp.]|uniref:hypothetical protein n=1 Tax=Lacibacter sp. TaxID=1915409 RepID=UPI002B4B01DC|nr:hypothetical protein [Lacibacter sp.]HLP39272.1 hypothetical protein [Lacibacter sp.]
MKLSINQITEIQIMIEYVLHELYEADWRLIKNRTNERAIVFTFGKYFYELMKLSSFKGYDLDCEYNRNLGGSKRTQNFPNGVIPDLLIHKRESNVHNVLVLEFKGYWNTISRLGDVEKINDFVNQNSVDNYKYGLGALIEINRVNPKVEYFIDYTPI